MSDQPFRTIVEPFRIHSVEPMRLTTRAERTAALAAAGYNLFELRAEHVLIDLLTDCGDRGDERRAVGRHHARRRSLRRSALVLPLRDGGQRACSRIAHVLPTHQGRAAERILFTVIGGAGRSSRATPTSTPRGPTSRSTGAEAIDLPISEGLQPGVAPPLQGQHRSRRARAAPGGARPTRVPLVMLTVTNNSGGGQPVSAGQPPRPSAPSAGRYRHAAVPGRLPVRGERLLHQAARARLRRPPGHRHRPRDASPRRRLTMSAKKDGLANIGGCAGPQRRRPAERVPQPADPHRRLPDLRRAGRARPRGDRPGTARGARRGLPALSGALDRLSR